MPGSSKEFLSPPLLILALIAQMCVIEVRFKSGLSQMCACNYMQFYSYLLAGTGTEARVLM